MSHVWSCNYHSVRKTRDENVTEILLVTGFRQCANVRPSRVKFGTMTHLNINDDTVLHGTPRDAYHTSTFIEDTVVGGILSQQPDELGSPV